MSAPTHTPGPWASLDRLENSRTLTHITNGAHIVCTLGTTRTDGSPNHSANARLIAAAPEMLAALKALMQRAVKDAERYAPDGNEPIWAFISDASDAIEKAKGGAK